MPFIGDEELDSLQRQIDISLEEKIEYENKIADLEESLGNKGKAGLMTNLFFGVLAGLAIGYGLFSFIYGGGAGLNGSKYAEVREQVIDSMVKEQEEFDEAQEEEKGDDTEDVTDSETAAADVKDSLKDQKVYSVQIKAFTDNKHPVLSTALAVIATKGDYYKYSIGVFNSLEEAHSLRLELMKIGFRDAFVASYVNEERQEIHKPE